MSDDVKFWRYYLREPGDGYTGWAEVVLGSNGFFATVSDYGNYAFGWRHHGMADFRQFWLRKSPSYVCSKLGKNDHYEAERTEADIKELIDAYERDKTWDEERVQEERDLLQSLSDNEITIDDWMRDTEIGDAWEIPVYDYPPGLQGFVKNILPLLAEAVRVDLEAEGLMPATQPR